MRALRVLPLLLLSSACSAPEAREVAAAQSSASSEITIAAIAPASVSVALSASSAPSAKLVAGGPEQATAPKPGECELPALRPASFGVKQLQHILPHGRPDSWVGGELGTKTNVCPRDPKARVVASCTTVSEAQMDVVYKALLAGRLCSLRHDSPPRRSSPHYGSRSITIYIGERSFEITDSSGQLLDEPSNKRFYRMTDVITETGLAATPAASP